MPQPFYLNTQAIIAMIENPVITSVEVKAKSSRPDTSGLFQHLFSCLQFPCRHMLPVWCECHVMTKVGCRPGESVPASV